MFRLNVDITLQICLCEHRTEDLIQLSTLNTLKVDLTLKTSGRRLDQKLS